ncbi:MAG: aldo/keto reductase, partial [Phycisphaerae bacterium]|nr:aldo/keto reductase [Phycisphaerae bacterium]
NFFDNAWEYHGGRSEEILGKALQGRREKAFVMTKHHGRDRKTAMAHLEDSLRRLKTDVIDLWMFHEVVYDADPDMIFAPDGGIEAAVAAKEQGKVRYVGFTGHKWPWLHLKMLAYGHVWDAVLMPLNILDGSFRSFESRVLPVCAKRGIAALAMKTRASGLIVRENLATAEECWRYVLALPVAAIVSGMESVDLLRKNIAMATSLEPMDAAACEAIRGRTREVAMTGAVEPFKTTNRFDGLVGRRLHGIAQ